MDALLMAWALPDLSTLGYIAQVAIGLGMVIFVHELGHFAVAKACGVKCEKFYLGFDFFGLKLCKFRWGETEYGIGIFPLGGYVKMLGQEDNPARLQEEIQRAKAAEGGGKSSASAASPSEAPCSASDSDTCRCGEAVGAAGSEADDEAARVAQAREALYNPRSYLAKPVPQRMAIIAAGVIMNFLFAIVTASIAYGLGVFHLYSTIGGVTPGSSAWQHNLQAGDRIVAIDGKPARRFEDIHRKITVDEVENGVDLEIERPGVKEPFTLRITPNPTRPMPTFGIVSSSTRTLDSKMPAVPGSAAAKASPALQAGDTIVAIDGEPVAGFADVARRLALHPDKTLRLTVESAPVEPDPADTTAKPAAKPVQRNLELPPARLKTLGLVMPLGPITVLQKDSPAEKAGLKLGDVIVAADGVKDPDAALFPEQMRRAAEQKKAVKLTVQRPGQKEPVVIEASPRPSSQWIALPTAPTAPLTASTLGIAYQASNQIARVEPNSPAAEAGVESGQRIVAAAVIPPPAERLAELGLGDWAKKVKLSREDFDFSKPAEGQWAAFVQLLQEALPGFSIEITVDGGAKYPLAIAEAPDAYWAHRGLNFAPDGFRLQADSFGDALALGADATWDATFTVFRFLRRLPYRLKAVGGPWMILQVAYRQATRGLPDFLMFLTLIGANLAVFNFLPIPLLDGGHMVFLAYEGVARKPPNERIQLTLSYLGLLLILALIVWTCGLDFGLISRH